MIVLENILYFLAGIFLHMSFMHHFSFERVKTHPMIRVWKSPKMAAAVWGTIQLACALLILALQNYKFGFNWNTGCIFLGYSAWAVAAALFSGKFSKGEPYQGALNQ